jgi:hypothetical protein
MVCTSHFSIKHLEKLWHFRKMPLFYNPVSAGGWVLKPVLKLKDKQQVSAVNQTINEYGTLTQMDR